MEEFYLYSIGHGAKTMEDVMEELKHYGIKYLIDIRTKPFSKFYPHFNKEALIYFFRTQEGITYTWWGNTIGGLPPAEWNCHTADGKIDYDKMAKHPIFISGVDRLVKANEQHCKTAIMCSESDPQMCHRSKLIGRMLEERGIELQHIVRNKLGQIIVKPQKEIFNHFIDDAMDLFGSSDPTNIHLTSRKAYV